MRFPFVSSLRARLLFFLLASIAAAALVQGAVAYRSTLQQADEIFDQQLQRTAASLSGSGALFNPAASAAAGGPGADDLIIQIWTADGARLFKSPSGRLLPAPAALGFSDVRTDAATYRVFALATPLQVTQVAQDMRVRTDAARTLALRSIGPIAAAAPLLMLVVWCVVSLSLRPVGRVRAELAQRQPEDLSPLAETGLPDEIRPLVREMNLLLERTRQALTAQKQFVADAAHELRSPLAALRLQLQSLQRADGEPARQAAAERLASGMDRATRLVEQLLSMARHDAAAAAPASAVELGQVVRQAISDMLPQINARNMDVGMNADGPMMLQGDPDGLALLVRNILDNAVKYTPAGGRIEFGLSRRGSRLVMTVDDSGPGIPEAERGRVFDRFYRAVNHDAVGSGLGLSIVQAVAQGHGATVSLRTAPQLGGLRVEVDFPATRSAPVPAPTPPTSSPPAPS